MTELVGSKKEASKFFGVSLPTIGNWIDEGCPVVAGGSNGVSYQLNFSAVYAWKKARDERAKADDEARQERFRSAQIEMFGPADLPAIDGAAPLSPKGQAELIRARREHLDLLERQRLLVPAAEVQIVLAAALKTLSQSMQTLPDHLQRQLGLDLSTVRTMREMIENHLNDLVDEIERRTMVGREELHAAAA